MGRGLSPLQLWIVNRATEQKVTAEGAVGSHWTADVLDYHEILMGYFEWPKMVWYWEGERREKKPYFGSRNFKRSWFPPGEYGRVMAVLSRSVRRLEQRGLIAHWGGSIRITEAGESLSVNSVII